ncbi:putative quinol monooxygenase [Agromyces aerolatus]|uniref:putative quinol monooxygenase n=1 Tax=Agromyces sp. LY-1074 TaxID=3074080 RepID=UPI0028550D4B|nr:MULTISPECIES: antibiotic biosynthesis monooxygenase [unclassified Agromyces]MDR5698976.1 antibiotic biosynthesis monooxygenase [Agromyces sp. LY-1074]MDR5705246.1 antibiotic biosynthesis monooxygenase [Agromyces sp. LY-1358]
MSEVVVTAVFRPVEGKREELIAALRAAIPAVHDEAGCMLYAIHDAEDGTITMLEKWATVEDLDAHGAGAPVTRLNELIDGLISEPVLVTCMTALPAGTAEQGLL